MSSPARTFPIRTQQKIFNSILQIANFFSQSINFNDSFDSCPRYPGALLSQCSNFYHASETGKISSALRVNQQRNE